MSGRTAEDMPLPGGDFILFITRLNIQALLSLGVMENPATGQVTVNLDLARMLLRDLEMIAEKTAGNLTDIEQAQLEKYTSDLAHALEQREG